jgi:DNA-binding phage protein
VTEAEAIRAITRAAKRRDRADAARREAVAELRERAREAQAAKVPISRIAEAAGLSRQGVYDLLAAGPRA